MINSIVALSIVEAMILILYNDAPAKHLTSPIGGVSTLERVARFARNLESALEEEIECRVITSEPDLPLPEGWRVQDTSPIREGTIAAALAAATSGPDTEIIVARLDQPFLNVELAAMTVRRHREFRAEYTFSDGYPYGLGVEVVSGRAVTHIESLVRHDTELERMPLFGIVQRDINRLDVETILSEKDNRLLRIDLSVAERPDLVLCRELAADEPESLEAWEEYADATRVRHRTLPRYVSIQVIEQEVQKLSYSPYALLRSEPQAPGRRMSVAQFGELVGQVAALNPSAWIHLSTWGEIGLHPDATALVQRVLAEPGLRLLVETSGLGWKAEATKEVFGIQSDRLRLIVGLDTNDEAVYRKVRGEGFTEAVGFARRALEKLGSRAYVQAVRSEVTEQTLDSFYREWKEQTENVLIQKFDHFCGRLPQQKIGDISPVQRFPCWHLQRDLTVLVDGTVPLCREDIDSAEPLGNVFSQPVESVWKAGQDRYAAHVSGVYEGICGPCDEYYTFSF